MFLKSKKKSKEKPKKEKKKKKDKNVEKVDKVNQKVNEKEHTFADVKMYRIMPLITLIGFLIVGLSFGTIFKNNHDYKVMLSRITMKKGTSLPLFQGESKGDLTVGNVIVSKDNKNLAAEIKYNDTAHQQLSSFGKKYKLYIVTSKSYHIENLSVKYGFFGTDGNGVLTVKSKVPFPNEAFVIMIYDKGQLISSSDIQSDNVTDETLDKSITQQLAGDNSSSMTSTQSQTNEDTRPPVYYIRVNPASSKRVDYNWGNNERKLVDNLFVKQNLAKYRKQIKDAHKKIKMAQATLKEYDKRLAENPEDQTALSGKQQMEQSISALKEDVATADKNYQRMANYRIKKDALGVEQTNFKRLQANNMQMFSGTADDAKAQQ